MDLKDKNFEGVSTYETNLTDTGAKVYFNKEEEEEIIDEIKIRLKIRSIQAK